MSKDGIEGKGRKGRKKDQEPEMAPAGEPAEATEVATPASGEGQAEAVMPARVEAFGRTLVCELSVDERVSGGRELADLLLTIETREDWIKGRIKALRDSLKVLKQDAAELSHTVSSGREPRMIECERVWDYSTKTVREFRKDTGAELSSRPMRPDELAVQEELPGTDGEPAQLIEEAQPEGQQPDAAKRVPLALFWPREEGQPKEDVKPATDADVFNRLIESAVQVIRDTRRAALSTLQRRLRVTAENAQRVMDELEKRGIVGPATGGTREILMAMDDLSGPPAAAGSAGVGVGPDLGNADGDR